MRLLAVLALVAINAFYVAGEFALVAVNRTTVERLAAHGHRRASMVRRALSRLSFHLSGAQLGITVTSLVLGFVAEPTLAAVLESTVGTPPGMSVVLALVLATVFQMVFGELVPKNVAIARPLGMAMWVGPPMAVANTAASPLITFLNGAANRTVRLLGIEPREDIQTVRSLEELELMIEASADEGRIDPEEAALLERSFDFARKIAGEVMTPRTALIALPSDATVADLAQQSTQTGKSRFPVYDGDADHIIGVVHVRDVFDVPPDRRPTTPVTEILRPPLVVPESIGLDALLRTMRNRGSQLAVVVDEHGGTAGIVTLEDLVEEIVGEIEDEYDARPAVEPEQGVLPGSANRFEVAEATGLELPEGRFETLAGFLLHLFQRIPVAGERITWRGWTLEVVEMDGHRIDRVKIIPPGED